MSPALQGMHGTFPVNGHQNPRTSGHFVSTVCSEHGKGSVLLQKVFLFVRLRSVPGGRALLVPWELYVREIEGSGFPLSHTEYGHLTSAWNM